MTESELLDEQAPQANENDFPPVWQQGDQQLALRYRFEPGATDDGVTATVPLALLARLSPTGFDWQVPGLRHELVTAMIKSMPKAIRRTVVPAADWASRIMLELPEPPRAPDQKTPTFAATVAATIKRMTGTLVSAEDIDAQRIPPHLRMTFRVIDDRGKVIASGKELPELQRRFSVRARESVAHASARTADPIERIGLKNWDFNELPRFVDTASGGDGPGVGARSTGPRGAGPRTVVRGYPTLVDEGDTVAIRVMATQQDQARELPGGVRRLLLNVIPSPVAYVQQHLTSAEKLTLAASPYPTTKALFDDCLAAVIDAVLFRIKPDGQVFMRAEFETIRDRASAIVMDSMFDTVSLVSRILGAARAADKTLSGASNMTLLAALTDAREQLSGLVHNGFVSATGLEQLRHLPRYLAGITWRIERLPDNPARDRVWMTEVHTATARFVDAGGLIPLAPNSSPSVVHARWMLEEFRVSLFAQQLGTAETVSLQRIQKVLSA